MSNSTISPDDIGFHLLEPKVSLAGAPAPPRQRSEIAVDPRKLEAYVGVYQLAPDFRLTISRDDGSLFGQATGQPRAQLFAESEIEFFLKVVDAQVTFVKDSTGKVNQLILHQNGSNIAGLKVSK